MICKDYYVRLACCAVMGAGKSSNGQCYTFGFELVSKKYKSIVCSVINAWDCSLLMWFNLYWIYLSKSWYGFYYF